MLWPISRRLSVKAAGLVLALVALNVWNVALAEDFPPVTDAERAITSVAGSPDAPAVVLYKTGDLRMPHPSAQPVTSILEVTVRLKILTAEGLDEGTVQIVHSGFTRLHDFEGRTVMADGTVVPLPKDASFVTTTSKARRTFVTSVAFPRVEVGAILDYRFALYWDGFSFLEPWYFAGMVPVVHSEITYHVPGGVVVSVLGLGPGKDAVKSEQRTGSRARSYAPGPTTCAPSPTSPTPLPAATFRPA